MSDAYQLTDIPRRASRYYSAQTEALPPVQPQPRRKGAGVFYFGVGMLIVIGAVLIFQQVINPTVTWASDQWHYGDARLTQLDADVGHGGISRFIAEVEHRTVLILEVPLSDLRQTRYYAIVGLDITAPRPVVTLTLADVNNDSKPDLLVHVEGMAAVAVLYNAGKSFTPNRGEP